MERIKKVTTREEIKIISDPYRLDIIKAFRKVNEPATAKQIAEVLGEKPSKINYHVHRLYEYGFLELKFTKSINGIIAKYYEVAFDEIQVDGSNDSSALYSETERMVRNILDEFMVDFRKSLKNKKNDDNDHRGEIVSSQISLTKDEVKEVIEYMRQLSKRKSTEGKTYGILAALVPIDEE